MSADGLVHREQLLQPPPPLGGDRLLQALAEPLARLLLQPLRLVGEVLLVERLQLRQRGAGLGEQMARRGVERPVRRVEPDVHHERRLVLGGGVDEVDRLVAQHVRLVLVRLVAVELELGRVGRSLLLDQRVVEVEGPLGDLPVPLVPAGGNRQRVRRAARVPVHVLADVDVVVAAVVEIGGDRVRLVRLQPLPAPERPGVAAHAVVVHVLPGQHARPRGAAEGVGDVGAVEGHPLPADQRLRVRHRRQLGGGHVVGEDEDDVVAGGTLGVANRERQGKRPRQQRTSSRQRRQPADAEDRPVLGERAHLSRLLGQNPSSAPYNRLIGAEFRSLVRGAG